MKPEMVITDLDGTFLNSSGKISHNNQKAMQALAELSVLTVIATGRSLYSVKKVVPRKLPVNYIVFSSGAGIYDWQKEEIIEANHLLPDSVRKGVLIFHQNKIDYFVHSPIPDNHIFDYYIFDGSRSSDSWRRIDLYQNFASKIENLSNYSYSNSCQIIGITRPGLKHYESIKEELSELEVIRTTSPLDHRSLWIEVFPKNISKATACEKIRLMKNIPHSRTLALGNDFNDLDLLNWAQLSYIVENAPRSIKNNYAITAHHDNDAFYRLIQSTFEV
jgi:hypothetical protein